MTANLPVAFGALLAGGLLIDKGAAAAKAAFAGTTSSSSPSSSSTSTSTSTVSTQPTTGPAAAERMLAAAQAATGGPYSQANHSTAIGHLGSWLKQFGTDCSGFVSYLMGPAGAHLWSSSYATPAIPTAPNVQAGPGTYVTIYNNPAPGNEGHVFIQILGQWFESAGGVGIHQMTAGEASQYLGTGSYTAYHPDGL